MIDVARMPGLHPALAGDVERNNMLHFDNHYSQCQANGKCSAPHLRGKRCLARILVALVLVDANARFGVMIDHVLVAFALDFAFEGRIADALVGKFGTGHDLSRGGDRSMVARLRCGARATVCPQHA
jgi:hypothetical protein